MGTIKSMTGFGRSEIITDEYRVLVEIKSVNHRYLDLSIKMPRKFNVFEARLRKLLKSYIERGKTDVYITYEDYTESGRKLIYNNDLAAEYINYMNMMAGNFGIRNDIGASVLSRLPEVITMEETTEDDDRIWEILEPAVSKAAENFCEERDREGKHLQKDLLGKLDAMDGYVKEIEEFSPSVVEAYRTRLYEKIKETLADSDLTADEGRIVTEVTIFADKVCTDEEMVRLKSHILAMKKKLTAGGSCGRELDFIAQEMNREANTTLSKANDLKIADTAIALKTEIEKIREQVQNIE
ncbi:MAG: YicC/YloC family endoribonuclease [Eubacteriales bacterium]|nr:YicC/YloC family endoribonuclease [Eubacteriales bacterium]